MARQRHKGLPGDDDYLDYISLYNKRSYSLATVEENTDGEETESVSPSPCVAPRPTPRSLTTVSVAQPRTRGHPPLRDYGYLGSPNRDHASPSDTPYRLPRLSPSRNETSLSARYSSPYRLWGQHGYDYYGQSESARSAASQTSSPRGVPCITHRQVTVPSNFPRFQQAMISPLDQDHERLYASNMVDPAFLKSMLGPSRGSDYHQHHHHDHHHSYHDHDDYHLPDLADHEQSTSSIPPGRTTSPVKSAKSIQSTNSVRWALSPYKNVMIDKQGQSHAQGPYSRGFNVTCAAPNNWLKMKWGRSKTTLV